MVANLECAVPRQNSESRISNLVTWLCLQTSGSRLITFCFESANLSHKGVTFAPRREPFGKVTFVGCTILPCFQVLFL